LVSAFGDVNGRRRARVYMGIEDEGRGRWSWSWSWCRFCSIVSPGERNRMGPEEAATTTIFFLAQPGLHGLSLTDVSSTQSRAAKLFTKSGRGSSHTKD
jgi:hypothetical protein